MAHGAYPAPRFVLSHSGLPRSFTVLNAFPLAVTYPHIYRRVLNTTVAFFYKLDVFYSRSFAEREKHISCQGIGSPRVSLVGPRLAALRHLMLTIPGYMEVARDMRENLKNHETDWVGPGSMRSLEASGVGRA
jgi:hypothetical protein